MGFAKDYKHDRQKDRQKNEMDLLKLLDKYEELRYSELKRELHVSDPTLSGYIKNLENNMERIEHFFKLDRRERWYRIKPESHKKVKASLGRHDAIQFIESFSNPVYSYKESKDGKKAIAAFMSLPLREDERKNAQSKVDGAVSHFLKAVETLLRPDKDTKFAVVVMVRKGITKEGSEP